MTDTDAPVNRTVRDDRLARMLADPDAYFAESVRRAEDLVKRELLFRKRFHRRTP